jgi:CHAD domain-containing protein
MTMDPNDRTSGNGKTSVLLSQAGPRSASKLGPDDPLSAAVQSALATGAERIAQHEAGARQGEAEAIHRMRTAARRLRSELRLYRGVLEGGWAEPLSEELQWLGCCLGAVRDCDVMRQRLLASAAELGRELEPLFQTLAERHAAAEAALRAVLDGERYHSLLEHLAEAAERPPLRESASEPCGHALPPLVKKSWRRLRNVARVLDLSDPDENYHEVRKRAKRARYSAEAAAPALEPNAARDALRFAKRATAVQDVLGEHQDATVACKEIGCTAVHQPGDARFSLTAGRLLERQSNAASTARGQFFRAWQKLDRKKNTRWLNV